MKTKHFKVCAAFGMFFFLAAQSGYAGWSTKAPLPTPRSDCQSGVINGVLYVAGGTTSGPSGLITEVDAYNPNTDTWSTKAAMNYPEYLGAAGIIDNKLYIVGGWSSSIPNDLLKIYDPASNTWTTGASMPILNGSNQGGVIDRKFYVLDTADGYSGLDKYFYVYDPDTNAWTEKTQPVNYHSDAAMAVYNGKFYAFGGWEISGSIMGSVEAYNPASDTWTSMASLPTPVKDSRAEVINNKIYLLGGVTGTGKTDIVQIYDPSTDSWSLGESMPVANNSFSSGVIDNKLYVTAGSTTTLNVYNPATSGIETPTSVVFDEVSSNSITASGYAATPAFTGLETGSAGVNVAKDGTYSTWRNGNKWTTKAGMLTAQDALSAGVIGGKLYAVGGWNGSYVNTNEEFDPVANMWATKAAMPTARYNLSVGVIGGKLYAMGGTNGSDLNTNEEYDPAANTWETKTVMPTGRSACVTGVIGGKLYAVGGGNGSWLNTNEEFDSVANTWATKAAMPTARDGMSAGVIYGKLYVVGGNNGSRLDTNEEYDPAANTWATKAIMPTARVCLSAGVIGGKLYAVGGWNDVSNLNTNEEYDPASNTWSTKAVMPTVRYSLSAGVIGGKLYAVGGDDGSGWNTNEEYDPGVTASFTALTPNTQYSFTAKARDSSGVETAESPTVSTYTLAAVPIAAIPAFTGANPNSVTVNWTQNGNPSGTTLYRAQASVDSAFGTVAASSDTYNFSAVLPGLSDNTVYYARVAAINGDGIITAYTALGSTATLVGATITSITPNSGFNNASGITVAGTGFASGATVKITKSGQTDINASNVTVVSANQITCTFNLTGAAAGKWSVVVTIPGQSPVQLTDGFTVISDAMRDSPQVQVRNNLFDPASGGKTYVDTQLSASGRVSVKVYDLKGRLVRTLFEGSRNTGDYSDQWNGKNEEGKIVGSGIYLVRVEGPGISKTKRVMVVK
ncbi:MAG: T9SS type A sorting domain-containing protein [Elusimicrobia bacterium]|nr:T9SS type A sorting domain-containing protein [Elusimicrobiota bacterium]